MFTQRVTSRAKEAGLQSIIQTAEKDYKAIHVAHIASVFFGSNRSNQRCVPSSSISADVTAPVIEDGHHVGAESLSTRGRFPSRPPPLLARDHCGSGGGGEVVGGPGGQARHAPLLLDGVRGAHDRDQGDDAQMPINLSAMTRVHEAKVI